MKNQWSSILDVDVHQYACKRGAGFRFRARARVTELAGGVHAQALLDGVRKRSPFELMTSFIFLTNIRCNREVFICMYFILFLKSLK